MSQQMDYVKSVNLLLFHKDQDYVLLLNVEIERRSCQMVVVKSVSKILFYQEIREDVWFQIVTLMSILKMMDHAQDVSPTQKSPRIYLVVKYQNAPQMKSSQKKVLVLSAHHIRFQIRLNSNVYHLFVQIDNKLHQQVSVKIAQISK